MKAKRIISALLCLVLIVAMLSVSAYAAYIAHYRLEKATLIYDHTAGGHKFPANKSIATLTEDLYSDATSTVVSLYDYVDKYRNETVNIPVYKLYFYNAST
jgi:hypothetical protein